MGNAPQRNRVKKHDNATYGRRHRLKHRRRDIDQIQDEVKLIKETGAQPCAVVKNGIGATFGFKLGDETLPGLGMFYCVESGRHFEDQKALDSHKKGSFYKRRLKDIAQKKYDQDEADWGAGLTKEVLPPAHPELAAKRAARSAGSESMAE